MASGDKCLDESIPLGAGQSLVSSSSRDKKKGKKRINTGRRVSRIARMTAPTRKYQPSESLQFGKGSWYNARPSKQHYFAKDNRCISSTVPSENEASQEQCYVHESPIPDKYDANHQHKDYETNIDYAPDKQVKNEYDYDGKVL